MDARLSIIMTVYNAAPFLRQSIGSILAQSYEDFEFVIIDDGSTDASIEIIREFRDSRIRYLRSEHRGRVASLNKACRIAEGMFIAIADADDISHPDRLSMQLRHFERYPDCDVVGSWVQVIDREGNDVLLRKYPTEPSLIADTMPYACSVAFPGSMFRRSIITSENPFNSSYLVAHDLDFWLRLLPQSRFHNLPEPLLQYRISADSLAQKHAETARRETLTLARSFFEKSEMYNVEQRTFGCARVEYYHGELRTARKLLARLLRRSPLTPRYWRFFIPTLLGERLFTRFRNSGFARLPGQITRHLFPRRSLSPP